MKLIIIAGIPNSGSTWQFNAVRLSLSMSDYRVYGAPVEQYDTSNTAPTHIIKTHEYYINYASRARAIFTSYRNINQVKESFARRKQLGEEDPRNWRHINRHLINLMKWQRKTVHTTWYNETVDNPLIEITMIQSALMQRGFKITATPAEVLAEMNKLEPPKEIA